MYCKLVKASTSINVFVGVALGAIIVAKATPPLTLGRYQQSNLYMIIFSMGALKSVVPSGAIAANLK
jgi:hypothetical protein